MLHKKKVHIYIESSIYIQSFIVMLGACAGLGRKLVEPRDIVLQGDVFQAIHDAVSYDKVFVDRVGTDRNGRCAQIVAV